jgi:hypothetical protein
MVELEDEVDVRSPKVIIVRLTSRRSPEELVILPQLPLVLAQVLDDERLEPLDPEQPLAGGVDGEPPEVAGDPPAVELLGHGRGGAGPAEAVEDQVAFVRRGLDDALEEGFGFLGGVIEALLGGLVDSINVGPNVPDNDRAVLFVEWRGCPPTWETRIRGPMNLALFVPFVHLGV